MGPQAIISGLGHPFRRALHLHHCHPNLVLLPACSPYRYGYITELRASRGFRYDNVKHYSMGRLAHEMGCASTLCRHRVAAQACYTLISVKTCQGAHAHAAKSRCARASAGTGISLPAIDQHLCCQVSC